MSCCLEGEASLGSMTVATSMHFSYSPSMKRLVSIMLRTDSTCLLSGKIFRKRLPYFSVTSTSPIMAEVRTRL